MDTLAARLREWTDLDYAMHEPAVVLGLVNEAEGSFAREFKWVYWSDNRYGSALDRMLQEMVAVNFLEYDGEEQKIRTHANFNPNVNRSCL